LLRYLSDAYRTIMRTIPDDAKTDEIIEIADWPRRRDPGDRQQPDRRMAGDARRRAAGSARPLSPIRLPAISFAAQPRLRALIRSRVFRWVQLASGRRWDALRDDLVEAGDHHWNAESLQSAFADYFAEHSSIGIDGDAPRGRTRFDVRVEGERWLVRQSLADPEGFDELAPDV